MSIILDLGWFGLGVTGGPLWSLSLGVVRLGVTVPVLARVLEREASRRRAMGRG